MSKFDEWAYRIVIIVLSLMIIAGGLTVFIGVTKNNDDQSPSQEEQGDSVFVRGNSPSAQCNVFVVVLEGHKYVVAVHSDGCSVCPAVSDRKR